MGALRMWWLLLKRDVVPAHVISQRGSGARIFIDGWRLLQPWGRWPSSGSSLASDSGWWVRSTE